jgi:hypothetical protein
MDVDLFNDDLRVLNLRKYTEDVGVEGNTDTRMDVKDEAWKVDFRVILLAKGFCE